MWETPGCLERWKLEVRQSHGDRGLVRAQGVNLTFHSHALLYPAGQPWSREVLDLGLPGPGAWVLPLPALAPDWRRLMAWAPRCLLCPCPSHTFIFQDLLCQRQKLCGEDEEDGEFSLCARPLWVGGDGQQKASFAGREERGRVGADSAPVCVHSSLTRALRLLCRCRDSLLCLLTVYFLNKPNCRNRPSLCLRCRPSPSSQTRLCPRADVHLTWLWS